MTTTVKQGNKPSKAAATKTVTKPVTVNTKEEKTTNEKPANEKPAGAPPAQTKAPEKPEAVLTGRDFTKYVFEGVERSKSRTMLSILTRYVKDRPETSFKQMKERFPDTLLKSYGVFQTEKEAKKKEQRFFLKPDELIQLSDEKIAVCNQVSTEILIPILMIAKDLGYKVEKSKS